ncbi:hypothetical protein [Neobacillus sp. PS3-40]|jgi:hypothetical protein|uniref:hypothetical protein n=1 Tax=Neobacillus sp. PS3-40 TaxID=3070679 RepID=UPI0027E13667|nr:hypothetical protein [Neobacillus sp. PS3-40]WML44413.1 hypothetical protein RCG20_00395 [Neobacillus sp. PS3-40]
MFVYEDEAMLVQDREDLIALLRMRFGTISPEVIDSIYKISQLDTIERLILVAANAGNLRIFLEEMQEGEDSFRILGDRYNPIENLIKRSGTSGE